MKKWQSDFAALQDYLGKLGLALILGGLVGLFFDKKIDVFTASVAIIGGMILIYTAVQRRIDVKKESTGE